MVVYVPEAVIRQEYYALLQKGLHWFVHYDRAFCISYDIGPSSFFSPVSCCRHVAFSFFLIKGLVISCMWPDTGLLYDQSYSFGYLLFDDFPNMVYHKVVLCLVGIGKVLLGETLSFRFTVASHDTANWTPLELWMPSLSLKLSAHTVVQCYRVEAYFVFCHCIISLAWPQGPRSHFVYFCSFHFLL